MTDPHSRKQSYPGQRWFKITVETPYGQLIPQQVEASNLRAALMMASDLPLMRWFPDEGEDERPSDSPASGSG